MSSMFGASDFNADNFSNKMEDMLAVIHQVNDQFRNPVSLAYCNVIQSSDLNMP